MMGDRSRLRNFIKKFIGTVRFGNGHFGNIIGYRDYVIGDSVISRVYYTEGLGHNLFSVGQFCDSGLEVAFRKHSCYVRDMNGVELIKGVLFHLPVYSRGSMELLFINDIKAILDYHIRGTRLEKGRQLPGMILVYNYDGKSISGGYPCYLEIDEPEHNRGTRLRTGLIKLRLEMVDSKGTIKDGRWELVAAYCRSSNSGLKWPKWSCPTKAQSLRIFALVVLRQRSAAKTKDKEERQRISRAEGLIQELLQKIFMKAERSRR
ncbi:hypothetical protein Tco_1502896 [Tanacetum coccineum]